MSGSLMDKIDVRPDGIWVALRDGSRRRYRFGVIGPDDIASVRMGADRASIIIGLRSGETVERSLDSLESVVS